MRDFFDSKFLENIPNNILEIPCEVRKSTGLVVKFREISPDDQSEHTKHLPPALLEIDGRDNSITIAVQREIVQPSNLAHELIHIRRYILESACMLWPNERATPYDIGFIQHFDNSLEHLFVVAEEVKACDGSWDWWSSHYDVLIDETQGNWLGLTMHLLFLKVVIPENSKLQEKCLNFLEQTSINNNVNESVKICEAALIALPSKKKLIDAIFHLLPLPLKSNVTFARYDVKNRKINIVEF